jgi:integrase
LVRKTGVEIVPRLSESYAATIVVPQGRRDVFVFDADHREAIGGFFFRKFSDTGRTFAGVKFVANGKPRRLSLGEVKPGTVATYRKLALEAKARARLGQDVVAERQQAREVAKAAKAIRYTFGKAVRDYLQARELGVGYKRPLCRGSFAEVTRHLQRYCRPLHEQELGAIRRADIVQLLDVVALNHGRVAANHMRTSVSGLCTWALDRGKIEYHPAMRLRPYGEPENFRALTEEELAQVWRASGSDTYGTIVKFGILTALRRSNLVKLAWSEVDLASRELRFPGSRMKNRHPFVLPLSDQAMQILEAQPRTRPLVFAGEGEFGAHLGGMSKRKRWLDDRINATRATPIQPWALHGLRATFVSIASDHDLAPPHILDELLAHRGEHKRGVAGIYNRSRYEAQKREAMQRWGAFVAGLVRLDPSSSAVKVTLGSMDAIGVRSAPQIRRAGSPF